MIRFVDTIKFAFTRELTGHIAGRLGESGNGIGKALGGLVPVVLASMVKQANANDFQALIDLSNKAYQATNGDFNTVTCLLGVFGSGNAAGSTMALGGDVLGILFGTSSSALSELVAEYSGIKKESAVALLGMVGAVLPALLGLHIATYELSGDSIRALLKGQKNQVRDMIPSGLQEFVGLTCVGEAKEAPGRRITAPAQVVTPQAPIRGRWFQAIFGLFG